MHNIIVRRLLNPDLDQLFDLRLESLKSSPESFLITYEEEKSLGSLYFKNILDFQGDSNLIFGAFVNNELTGFVGIYKKNLSKVDHRSHIWGTFVKANFRNKGVGKALIQAAIAHAENKMRCSTISLSVISSNVAAKNLYNSFGFKTWGTEPNAYLIDGVFHDELHAVLFI